MAVVQTSDYDTAVDKATSHSYIANPLPTSRYDNDVGFASCLNATFVNLSLVLTLVAPQ